MTPVSLARQYAAALLALALTACTPGPDSQVSSRSAEPAVPAPTEVRPLAGGVRTGEPFGTTMAPLLPGYVEEEFAYGGMARGHDSGDTVAYTSRMIVRRPVAAEDFNGTVVFDWNNVTLQMDVESVWAAAYDALMGRGYIYVSVSAQKQGVDGSPLGVALWDPVRYAGLSHPGDDYSYDIYAQAVRALEQPSVLPDSLRQQLARRIATGSSQSAGRLSTYINEIHERDQVFDGFLPLIAGSVTSTRDDLVPILWINSQDEAAGITSPPTDTDLLRYWEVPGPPHTTNAGEQYILSVAAYNHGNALLGRYDPELAGQYGEMDPQGTCSRNRFPTRYVWSAGVVALDNWLRSGRPPASWPAITRDGAGELTFDEHGNALGGFRLPVVDVPIAAYYAGTLPPIATLTACAPGGNVPLVGTSQVFDPAKMQALYPSHEAYLEQLEPAVAEAVASGRLLPEHGEDLLRRARAGDVTNPVPVFPPPLPIGGGIY